MEKESSNSGPMKLKVIFRRSWNYMLRILKGAAVVCGVIFVIAVVLSFSDYPFWAYYWLGTHNSGLEVDPEVIVVMGGGGMPGPDGLMRCYFAAEVANECPEALVIIAVPGDTARKGNSPELMMCRELQMRGVDSIRVFYERDGVNTRSQAMNILKMIGPEEAKQAGVRIVTSPEHMYRSVAVFRKVGFAFVGGKPSFEKDIEEELLVKKDQAPGEEPQSIRALSLRYNIWNYMKYEITVLREYCAIAYYRLRGWM